MIGGWMFQASMQQTLNVVASMLSELLQHLKCHPLIDRQADCLTDGRTPVTFQHHIAQHRQTQCRPGIFVKNVARKLVVAWLLDYVMTLRLKLIVRAFSQSFDYFLKFECNCRIDSEVISFLLRFVYFFLFNSKSFLQLLMLTLFSVVFVLDVSDSFKVQKVFVFLGRFVCLFVGVE